MTSSSLYSNFVLGYRSVGLLHCTLCKECIRDMHACFQVADELQVSSDATLGLLKGRNFLEFVEIISVPYV